MRKLTAALFALLLLAAMAGCSSDDSDDVVQGDGTSQAESNGDDGTEASEDDAPDDASDEDPAEADDDSQDDPVDSGEPVSVPSGLVDDIKAMAADEDEAVTDEEAACIAEMLVIVLGEDGARDAVAGGVDEVDAAMGEATDDFSDEAFSDMLTSLSDECRVLMTEGSEVGVDGGGVEAPAGGLGD